MSSTSATLRGRIRAEAEMISTCLLTRRGERVLGDDGLYTVTTTTVYTGKCKFRQGGTQVSQVDAGGQLLVSQDSILSLPVLTSTLVIEGDDVLITGSPLDPGLIDQKFIISGGHAQSLATARRFPVRQDG